MGDDIVKYYNYIKSCMIDYDGEKFWFQIDGFKGG